MEPEIIFGEMFKDAVSKKIRRDVYETVGHINSFHPVKITKVVVYINKDGEYITEMWSGVHYSKQRVNAGCRHVEADKGILYAHLRVSEKAVKHRLSLGVGIVGKTSPNVFNPYHRDLWKDQEESLREIYGQYEPVLRDYWAKTRSSIPVSPNSHIVTLGQRGVRK